MSSLFKVSHAPSRIEESFVPCSYYNVPGMSRPLERLRDRDTLSEELGHLSMDSHTLESY